MTHFVYSSIKLKKLSFNNSVLTLGDYIIAMDIMTVFKEPKNNNVCPLKET